MSFAAILEHASSQLGNDVRIARASWNSDAGSVSPAALVIRLNASKPTIRSVQANDRPILRIDPIVAKRFGHFPHGIRGAASPAW